MNLESRIEHLEKRVSNLESSSTLAREKALPRIRWPFVFSAAFFVFFLVRIFGNAFNWPQVDDFLILDWYRKFSVTREYSLYDLITIKNGPHPVGLQALLSVLVWLVTGPNFVVFPILNVLIVGVASCLVMLSVRAENSVVRWIFPVAVVAILLHPIQANHLIWPFEFGWFLVTLFVALNVWLIERYGAAAWPWLILVSAMASLSSGQGAFAWFLVAIHVVARERNWKSLLVSAVFLVLFVFVSLRLAQGGSGLQVIATKGWPDFILYLIQLLGSTFGSRDPAVCARLGGLMIFLPLLSLSCSWYLTRTLTPMARVGSVYFFAAITMTAGFGFGRFQYGLPWALDTFHAGPLLVPMSVAALCLGCDLFAHAVQSRKRFVSVAVVTSLFPLASVVTATPYSTVRFEEQNTARALAMHVACFDKPDERRLLATSYLAAHRMLVLDNISLLMPMCVRDVPARSQKLLTFPQGLVRAAAGDARKREALEALWQIYQTHLDLKRAFNMNNPDFAHKLVEFAKNDAATGSQYAPEALRQYAEVFMAIGDF